MFFGFGLFNQPFLGRREMENHNSNLGGEKKEEKVIWLVTCSGAENGQISPRLLRKLPALKSVLLKLGVGCQIICGPDEQQRRVAEELGFFPNTFLPEYTDLAAASLLIKEELIRQASGSIVFASPKLLMTIGAVRIVNGKELPGCYGFHGSLKNYSLYKIFVNQSSGQIEYIGRHKEKKPPWEQIPEPANSKPP